MLDQNISEINHNASPFSPALKYGVIRGLVAVAIILLLYLSGILEGSMDGSNPILGTIIWLVGLGLTVLFVVLAINEHKANRGGNISIGQAIGVGILTTLVYGVIIAIWTYVFYNFIFTGYEEVMLDMMTSQYEEAGMSDDEIETAMGIAGAFTSPTSMAGIAGFMPLFTGLFAGLITGAVVKTN